MKKTLTQCPQVSAVVNLRIFLSKSFLGLAGTEIFQPYLMNVKRKRSGFVLSVISQWNSFFWAQNVDFVFIAMLNITFKDWIRSLWWEQTMCKLCGLLSDCISPCLWQIQCSPVPGERTTQCTTCNFVKDERLQEQKLKFQVLLSLHLCSKNSDAVATTRILCYSLFELWYNPKMSRQFHLMWRSNILILKAASEKFHLHLGNQGFLWKQTMHWCRILPKTSGLVSVRGKDGAELGAHSAEGPWACRDSWAHHGPECFMITSVFTALFPQLWNTFEKQEYMFCKTYICVWTSVFEKQEYMFSRNKLIVFNV